MSSKKRDLEIVYSLRWKNRTKREESKEMSVVVVVYDIPSTTLNFETFKNYLVMSSYFRNITLLWSLIGINQNLWDL